MDEDKFFEHSIAPSIKLPPMNLNSKHRNYSFEAQPHTNRKQQRKMLDMARNYN